MDSDEEYDSRTNAYLALPPTIRPTLPLEVALRTLKALPEQVVSITRERSEPEIIQMLHKWACVVHDMGQVEIPATGEHPRKCPHERNRDARNDALAKFYTELRVYFPDVYDKESTDNVITRMEAIFDEGIREDDAVQWKSCLTCPKQVGSEFMEKYRWDVETQEYVLTEKADAGTMSGADDTCSASSWEILAIPDSNASKDAR